MPSFAVSPYLAPYAPYLRPPTYYALWTFYYLSFLLSPILITILQMLTLLLPLIERAVEAYRRKVEVSEWGREEWAFPEGRGGGGEESEWVRMVKGYVDVRPAMEDAWAKVVEKLRGLSASMGWDTKVQAGGAGDDGAGASAPLLFPPRANHNVYHSYATCRLPLDRSSLAVNSLLHPTSSRRTRIRRTFLPLDRPLKPLFSSAYHRQRCFCRSSRLCSFRTSKSDTSSFGCWQSSWFGSWRAERPVAQCVQHLLAFLLS